MRSRVFVALSVSVLALTFAFPKGAVGQTPSPTPPADTHAAAGFVNDVIKDEKAIWTSPFQIKKHNLKVLVPFAALAAGLIASDRVTGGWPDKNGSLPAVSRATSKLVWAAEGSSAGLFLVGKALHNDKAARTGRLAAEALIGTRIVTLVLKNVTGRLRPDTGDGGVVFFHGGNSFPSGHTSRAFAVATVVSHQYRTNPWIKYGSYALAAAIGMSRYSGRKHFISDVLVGGAIGYGIGQYVNRSH